MMNDEGKTGRVEAKKSGREEKTICVNLCNLWTGVFKFVEIRVIRGPVFSTLKNNEK
jgi:hypothetical protein